MAEQDAELPPREAMEYDVVVVGAGPAGLAAAIRLKQVAPDLSVVVIEKGSEPGAHILSGAVIDPIGLDRLLPDWRKRDDVPLKTQVHDDHFLLLSEKGGFRMPNVLMPQLDEQSRQFHRLARQCRALPRDGSRRAWRRDLSGLRRRGDSLRRQGRGASASRRATWASGATASRKTASPAAWSCAANIRSSPKARAVRSPSSFSQNTISAQDSEPQKFGIGFKELWRIPKEKHKAGPRAALLRLAAARPTRAAAPSSITSRTISCRSASSCISTIRIRRSRPSTNSSASRRIR